MRTPALGSLAALAAIALLVVACSDDDDQTLVPPPDDSHLTLVVNVTIDGESLAMGTPYDAIGETTMQFNRVSFYLSGFGFENQAGETAYPTGVDAFLFNGASTAPAALPGIERDPYTTLHLKAGLPPEVNHADPLQAVFPLDEPSMHWNWNPDLGYIFARIEGMYDSSGDGQIGLDDDEFQYHCASSELLRSFTVDMEDVVLGDTLRLDVDLRQLLGGLDVPAEPIAHGDVESTVKIMNNFFRAVDVGQ